MFSDNHELGSLLYEIQKRIQDLMEIQEVGHGSEQLGDRLGRVTGKLT